MDTAYEIAELKRRLDNLIRICTIVEIDYTMPAARVSDGVSDPSGWLPFMSERANGTEVSWDAPEIGERVLVLSVSGDLANGRILPGALYCADSPAPEADPDMITRKHSDGAYESYDRANQIRTVEVPQGGEIRFIVGGTTLVLTDEGFTLTTPKAVLDAEVHLAGEGGKPVARKDDAISTQTEKITEGSEYVFSN